MIFGTAAAASSRSTVMRTISEPARCSAATWRTVPSMSAVSVLVIDCTTIGAPPPTVTLPTFTATLCAGSLGPAWEAAGEGAVAGVSMEFPSPKRAGPAPSWRTAQKMPEVEPEYSQEDGGEPRLSGGVRGGVKWPLWGEIPPLLAGARRK